jgi:signal transduction histidine kinase
MSDLSTAGTPADLAAELASARAELARTTAELAARRAEAAAAGRTRSEFLATMSHELRTPLNAVLGYAQLLDMGVLGPATPEQQAHLARLQASARHLLRLVDDVLDIAKIDAERLHVRADLLVTSAAIAAAVALVQPEATARGVRLIDAGADTTGFPFVGDEHRVRQILVNLLSNAVKFTPPGGTITVECGQAAAADDGTGGLAEHDGDRGPGWTVVRVRDTGPGIPAELMERIFDPFVQGEGGLTREQGGTGLGLAISRRLARLMGGDITVQSELGKGATFTVWLPTPPDGNAPPQPSQPARRRTPPLGIPARAGEPLPPAAYAILQAIGTRLATDTEAVAVRYVDSLRADPGFPGSARLPMAQLRDHFTPFVGLIASQLMTIGETHGRAPELLADGGQVQRLMAELHGVQRHRLGWSESDLLRETPLMLEQVQHAIRNAVERPPSPKTDAGPLDEEALRRATEYAVEMAGHVIMRSEQTAVRAFRAAAAAEER